MHALSFSLNDQLWTRRTPSNNSFYNADSKIVLNLNPNLHD